MGKQAKHRSADFSASTIVNERAKSKQTIDTFGSGGPGDFEGADFGCESFNGESLSHSMSTRGFGDMMWNEFKRKGAICVDQSGNTSDDSEDTSSDAEVDYSDANADYSDASSGESDGGESEMIDNPYAVDSPVKTASSAVVLAHPMLNLKSKQGQMSGKHNAQMSGKHSAQMGDWFSDARDKFVNQQKAAAASAAGAAVNKVLEVSSPVLGPIALTAAKQKASATFAKYKLPIMVGAGLLGLAFALKTLKKIAT